MYEEEHGFRCLVLKDWFGVETYIFAFSYETYHQCYLLFLV